MSAAWPFFFSHWATSRQIDEFDRWSGGPAVPHNSIAACLTRRSPARLTFEINGSELLAVVVAQASCCSTDRLRWLCARCRRKCCAAAWLSYRERNRPPCVAACSWRVLIGKCGPTESTPGVTAVPLMPAVIAHDEGGTDVLDRPGRREAAGGHSVRVVRLL